MRIAVEAHTVNIRLDVPRSVAELVANCSSRHEVVVFSGPVADLEGYDFRFVRVPVLSNSRLVGHASFLALASIEMSLASLAQSLDFEVVHSHIGPGLSANVMTSHFYQSVE